MVQRRLRLLSTTTTPPFITQRYGELAPSGPDAPCELHNQMMTLTTISEH